MLKIIVIIETDRNDRMRARYVAMANGPLSDQNCPAFRALTTTKDILSIPVVGTTTTPAVTPLAI